MPRSIEIHFIDSICVNCIYNCLLQTFFGNCAFPQNLYTKKLGEIRVWYAVSTPHTLDTLNCSKYKCVLFGLLYMRYFALDIFYHG